MRLLNRLRTRLNSGAVVEERRAVSKRRQRGHAVIEIAMLSPWIFFLFAGIVDMGFYAYALISTENAARVAVVYTSTSSTVAADSTGACTYALAELNSMSNVRGVSTCNSLPVQVTASQVTGADGQPASSVSVTYQTITMIPIPGLTGQLTVTRTAQMRLRS
jgi:Flp pilus assembly protein TadG